MAELHRGLLDRREIHETPPRARHRTGVPPRSARGGVPHLDARAGKAPISTWAGTLLFDEGLPEPQVMRHTGPDSATTTYPLVGHELFDANSEHPFVSVLAG
jgi:hypothetical protein